jgi:hypothetical protein
MSTRLKEALRSLLDDGPRLFGKLTVQAAQQGFMRLVGNKKSQTKKP